MQVLIINTYEIRYFDRAIDGMTEVWESEAEVVHMNGERLPVPNLNNFLDYEPAIPRLTFEHDWRR